MKKQLFLAALLGCTLLLQAQSANDEADMYNFARNFMNAYNQQDHEAIRKMYLDDAVRIDAEGKQIKGADNIAAYFADQFVKNNATVFIRQLGVNWSDSEYTWVASGTYEVNGKTNVYDIPVHFAGTYANAMLKKDGQWKIAKSVLRPLEHADPTVAANIKMYTEVWHEIVNEGRLELFNAEHFMPDVIMHAEPENVVGIEAMSGYYKALTSAFSDIKFTINNIFGEGDQLVKHWTFAGKHTGDFFGIPATGNMVEISGSTIVRMSTDGRIAEERDFMDNMALLSQLGVVSAPGNVAKEILKFTNIIGDTLRYDVGEPVFDIVISSDTTLYWKSLNPKYGTEAHEKIVVIPISEHENMVSYVEHEGRGPGVCWYNDFARGITTVSVFVGESMMTFSGTVKRKHGGK